MTDERIREWAEKLWASQIRLAPAAIESAARELVDEVIEECALRAEKWADDLAYQSAMRGAVRYAADAIRNLKAKPR